MSEGACCHDYDDFWRCKLCGYQLPSELVKRIGEPLKRLREAEDEE